MNLESRNTTYNEPQRYGIAPTVIIWIESFLGQRTFQVNVNGALSQTAEAISGDSQGSVIGPILFVIKANDLLDHLSADTFVYTDDIKLIAPP